MYQPSHFLQTDRDRIAALVAAHPLATLVTREDDDSLCADPVPLLWEPGGEHGVLRGHVARANPLWRRSARPVLAVFNGPQAYVSPSWYPTKQAHGKVVPTWNYAVVHVHARLRAVEDETWLRGLLQRLTDAHEAHRPQPWRVEDAPPDFTGSLLRAIVGLELEVLRVEAKWKLSQNRSAEDRQGVVDGLRQEPTGDAQDLARWMTRP